MKLVNPPALIQPAISRAEIIHRWDSVTGREQRSLSEFRTEKAKILIQARGTFGVNGYGFKEFVEKELKTPYRTAIEWMKDAGYETEREKVSSRKSNQCRNGTGSSEDSEGSEDSDSEEDDESEPDRTQNNRTAFILDANLAAHIALYSGPVDKETISMARRVADAWARLVKQMENTNE